MQLFVDILFIAVFAFLLIRGWLRGFLKAVLSLGRLILALLITIIAGPAVAGWLDEAFIHPAVYDSVFNKLSELADEVAASAEGGVEAFAEKLPAMFRDHIDTDALDPSAELDALVESWSESISTSLSGLIANVVGYILLFVVSFLVLTLVIFIVGKFAKVGFVKRVDKLLGLALGALSGAVAVMLLSVILGAVLSIFGQGEIVESSFMLRLFEGVRNLLLG